MCPHNSQGVWIVVPELAPCPSSFWFSSEHNTKEKMSPDNPESHRGWVDDIGNQRMPLDPDHISCMLEALAASDADDEGTGKNLGALGGIWQRFRSFRSKLERGIIPALVIESPHLSTPTPKFVIDALILDESMIGRMAIERGDGEDAS